MDDDSIIVSQSDVFTKVRNMLLIGTATCMMVVILYLSFVFGNGIFAILFLLITIPAIAYYLKKGIVKQITVRPEHIVLAYYFREIGRVVLYNEIDSIQTFRSRGGTQAVNLKDGSQFEYTGEAFKNYDDLKHYLFVYMVAANRRDAIAAELAASLSGIRAAEDVIVSEVGTTYYVGVFGYFAALAACLIISGYNYLFKGYDGYLHLTLVLIVAGILGKVFYVGKIKKLTVSPDYMVIDYVGKKPQEVIDYTQIVSNRSLSSVDKGVKGSFGGYHKQILDLDDGRQIIYTSLKFDNYEDLKHHIFRYMVAANQKRQTTPPYSSMQSLP